MCDSADMNSLCKWDKTDMVVALINAAYLLQQDVLFDDNWSVQFLKTLEFKLQQMFILILVIQEKNDMAIDIQHTFYL